MTKTLFGSQPNAIQFMPLPGGNAADVWLRKNITPPETEKEDSCWIADEVYFRTTMSEAEVQEYFDTLFDRDGLLTNLENEISAEEALAIIVGDIV